MCSNAGDRLARICQAIDELAGHASTGSATAAEPGRRDGATAGPGKRGGTAADLGGPHDAAADLGERGGATADPGGRALADAGLGERGGAEGREAAADDLAARLAAAWAIVADADPELAKRVRGYLDAAG